VIRTELDAAGIRLPRLRAAYQWCRQLNAAHGRTYFLATRMLPPAHRPAIHALYGFARWVDDIVDNPSTTAPTRETALDDLDAARKAVLSGDDLTGVPHSSRLLLGALADTVRRYEIDQALFTDFMTSMRMDLTVTEYPTRAALEVYTRGSASAIGLQVLPVLGTVTAPADAVPHAAALGYAFQLTNFLRDVTEDLDRGRVYLPSDELAVFGVDRDRLLWCRRHGRPDRRVRHALSDQVARARAIYRQARPGIPMLRPESRTCVATALTLYSEILDRVVESGYDVFRQRVAVPPARRLSVAVPALAATVAGRAVRRR
jgi:phytoene synthase